MSELLDRVAFSWATGITSLDTLGKKMGFFLFRTTVFSGVLSGLFLFNQGATISIDSLENFNAALFIVTGGYLAWLSFRYSLSGRLLRVLRAYIFGAFMFAGLYYSSYTYDKSSFSFSSGIMSQADLKRFAAVDYDMRRNYRESVAASDLFEWISKMPANDFAQFLFERTKYTWVIDQEVTMRFIVEGGGPLPTSSAFDYIVQFVDSEGELDLRGKEDAKGWPLKKVSSPEFRLVEDKSISKAQYLTAVIGLKQEIAKEARLLKAKSSSVSSRAFGLLDFVYFSFETVTTLGYGDMIPNATWIRGLIVCQILFGFFLVNAVSEDRPQKARE